MTVLPQVYDGLKLPLAHHHRGTLHTVCGNRGALHAVTDLMKPDGPDFGHASGDEFTACPSDDPVTSGDRGVWRRLSVAVKRACLPSPRRQHKGAFEPRLRLLAH